MPSSVIRIHNTLSREIEEFKAIHEDEVRIYSCGPTVYRSPHIGGLRHYITADVLKRLLAYDGYGVKQVINITDVGHLTDDADQGEDKIEIGSREMNISAKEVANYYTREFKQDLERVSVTAPSVWAFASEHIPEQIAFIEELTTKGYTYEIADGVYFDTSKSSNYGYLARLDIAGLKEGARVETNPEKRNPTDFALWKRSPKESTRQMEWDSPWGIGFPGWHIECSAMARFHLGFPFDIHTSAIDHIPVHHTNEIAQNEAVFDAKTVNYWVHNGHLLVNNQRMAKSSQNTYRLEDIIESGYDPLSLRYFFYTAHYRSQQNFTWEALTAAAHALEKIRYHMAQLPEGGEPDQASLDAFMSSIRDDLNLPVALASLWETIKSELSPETKRATLLGYDKILGLDLTKVTSISEIPEVISLLVAEREAARANNEWEKADNLRKKIEESGFIIKDSPTGPIVRPH